MRNERRVSPRTLAPGALVAATVCALLPLGACGGGSGGAPAGPTDPGPRGEVCAGYPDWRTSPYVLPYPPGEAYLVAQGNCTTSTHQGLARYAYDFWMPIGSLVTAARTGRVVRVVDEFPNFNGIGNGANGVTIVHADGTAAVYLHLDRGSPRVSEGDTVRQGDAIARSGASGVDADRIPHLHFLLKQADDPSADSLPVAFRNTDPNPDGLQQNVIYPAYAFDPD